MCTMSIYVLRKYIFFFLIKFSILNFGKILCIHIALQASLRNDQTLVSEGQGFEVYCCRFVPLILLIRKFSQELNFHYYSRICCLMK